MKRIFGWRVLGGVGCPRKRGAASGAGGVAQIAPGIDAFTRHTVFGSANKTRWCD